jgi:hypothetical protein
MLFFLGTPFGGSQLAGPATLLTQNATIQEMLRSSRIHTWLDEQQAEWTEQQLRDFPPL